MAYRRRRAKFTWFPQDPTFYDETPSTHYWTNIQLTGAAGSVQEVLAIPVLPDRTFNDADVQAEDLTLRDYVEGQDYILKRMVGKVWGSVAQDEGSYVKSVIAAMGFAILPVNDSDNTPSLDVEDYDPLNPSNSQNPWIWRRTWILANALNTQSQLLYPTNIGAYGSVMDGGHVDSRVSRRVTREQRLYHITTARILEIGGGEAPGLFQFGFDIRCLGAMRRHRNQSSFK